MDKQFKNYYQNALSGLNLSDDNETMSKALGLDTNRMKDLAQSFKSYVEGLNEGNHKRASVWAGALYHCDPQSLMEVYALGAILGAFEYDQEFKPDKNNYMKNMLIKASASAMSEAVEYAINKGDYDKAIEFAKDFSELIKEEL